jgi:hypothetical protein
MASTSTLSDQPMKGRRAHMAELASLRHGKPDDTTALIVRFHHRPRLRGCWVHAALRGSRSGTEYAVPLLPYKEREADPVGRSQHPTNAPFPHATSLARQPTMQEA